MANHADHGPDQVHPVPRRNKSMHASKFDDPIHTSFGGQSCQLPLFLRISHAQTQRLYDTIELCNCLK